MTLVELMVAISILAIVMSGLALSIGVDYKAVALARARQVAEAAANKRLEELRDVDYATMALADTDRPTHSFVSTNPDYFVTPNTGNGTTYDVTGAGLNEALIIADPGEPGIAHIETPVTIGTTVLDVYQYVTWVDDPGIAGTQNLKRLTVVVQYHSVPTVGQARLLRESVILTAGNVVLPAGSVTTTSSSTTTTTAAATTTTTTASTCGSFAVAGSSGAANGFTASATVTLTMTGFSGCGGNILINFSNDGGTTWGTDFAWSATTTALAWTLTGGSGTKTIAARARSGSAGTPWTVPAQSIILDTTPPSTPTSISRTASCAGSTRTVVLSWTSATDTYLVGYHVYVSSDGTTYSLLASVSGNSKTTTNSKGSPIYYKVKAYDSAGNESSATSVIALAKNQCS
jgi:type II secretory pathway pseudopilin PulG